MKKQTKKLVLKKSTVQILKQKLNQAVGGGSLRICTADASGCAGTGACCHHTK